MMSIVFLLAIGLGLLVVVAAAILALVIYFNRNQD